MTRWVPAIGIAGFARWFVSGRRRSPTPPTRTNASDSVSAIPAPSCGAAVHAHPAAKPAQPALGGGEMGDYADVLDAAARVRPFGFPAFRRAFALAGCGASFIAASRRFASRAPMPRMATIAALVLARTFRGPFPFSQA